MPQYALAYKLYEVYIHMCIHTHVHLQQSYIYYNVIRLKLFTVISIVNKQGR